MATQPAESRVVLTPEQREQLESIAKSRSLPAGLVARARIILMSAEATQVQIAQTLGISRTTVAKWQHRFGEGGVTGLYDELRPGRPRSVSDERVARLVKRTLETKPSNGTHWSVRQIATESKLTKSTVHRIGQAFGLQPHRQKHFKLSHGPVFRRETPRYRGLYLRQIDKVRAHDGSKRR